MSVGGAGMGGLGSGAGTQQEDQLVIYGGNVPCFVACSDSGGVPGCTDIWQVGDIKQQNGDYKVS
eukprot:1322555-Ditylum_brightwellii.AAC.1